MYPSEKKYCPVCEQTTPVRNRTIERQRYTHLEVLGNVQCAWTEVYKQCMRCSSSVPLTAEENRHNHRNYLRSLKKNLKG